MRVSRGSGRSRFQESLTRRTDNVVPSTLDTLGKKINARRITVKKLTYLSAALIGLLMAAADAPAQNAASTTSAKPTIVLAHGAFADALGWQYVIPILKKDGYNVIAVEKEFAASLQRRTS